MRLGLVLYGSLATTSGGYLYDRKFVSHLRDRGDSVEVIPLPRPSYPRAMAHNFLPTIRKRLASTEADVLLQDELCHPSLFWINRYLPSDLPIVSIVHHLRTKEHHDPFRNRFYRAIERQYLRTVDGAICTSHTTRADVAGLHSRDLNSVVAYPGTGRFDPDITATKIDERAHDPGPLRILFVGDLIPRKGVKTLIQGVSQLPADGWQLTIVGDRSVRSGYVESLEGEISRLDIDDHVEFSGKIPDSSLEAELERSHVFAVPSTYEGFGIAYLEAMGFGLPPIATSMGGPSEFIDDAVNGYLLPPGDPERLAETIRPLMADRDRLASLGQAALKRSASHPTWEESMEKAREFLTRTAVTSRPGQQTTISK